MKKIAIIVLSILIGIGIVLSIRKNRYIALEEVRNIKFLTEENRQVIGKEIYIESETSQYEQEEEILKLKRDARDYFNSQDTGTPEADSVYLLPVSKEDNMVQSFLTQNGEINVLENPDSTDGKWNFQKGDTIICEYQGYPSVIPNQKIVIGMIKDSHLMKGEMLDGLEGEFTYVADESGVYDIYVYSASSDPVALEWLQVIVEEE